MANIRQELFKGVFWSAIEKYSGIVVNIGISMILARLLGPEEYGVVAIAAIIISFLQLCCNMGIGPAIIQRKDLSETDCHSIFTFTVIIGSLFAGLFFCSSWIIASFYGNSQLIIICQVLSIQLIASSANMVPNALMNKNKRFKEKAKRTLFFQITCGILAILAAYSGAGVYALLITPIVTSIGVFVWNTRFYPMSIDRTFNMEPVKRISSFSLYQFLYDLATYFSYNLDKLVIGKYMNVSLLGIYEKSYNLMQMPIQNVAFVIHPVLQPVLRDMEADRENLAAKFAEIIKLVSTISFPLGITLSCMAGECIHFFYGGKWDGAIPIFRIMALSIPLQMVLSISGSLYLICNNTKAMFWVGIRNTLTTIVGFFVSIIVWGTLEAVAWTWIVTLTINFSCSYYILHKYVLYTSAKPILIKLVKPLFLALILFFVMYNVNNILNIDILLLAILLKASICFIVSLLYIQLTKQYDLIALTKNRIIIHE